MDDIAGYVVRRLLGSGSTGTVWLARDLGSGRPVVVKRIPTASVPNPDQFRRDLALAQGLDHPHVARLLEIRQLDREWLLVSEHAPAGSLSDLLDRRGRLSPGELVTLIGPLAQALAAAHRAGLPHGHLGAGDVVFTADGRPLLTDLGLRSTTGSPDAVADISALADLTLSAGADPELFSADLFDTDAATVASRVFALTTAKPINLAFGNEPASPPARQAFSTRPTLAWWSRRSSVPRRPHGALLSAGLAALIVLAFGAVLITRLDRQPSAATSNAPTSATPSAPAARQHPRTADPWLATLRALDVRRSHAFATLDEHQLDAVYVPGSQPWRSDRSLLASYQRRSLRVLDLSIRIERVTVARPGHHLVVLSVVDRLAGGTAIDSSGHRTALPRGPTVSRLITLTRPGGRTAWRITRIVAA